MILVTRTGTSQYPEYFLGMGYARAVVSAYTWDPAIFLPAAPMAFSADALAFDHVRLVFFDRAINETSFRIERRTEDGEFISIGTIATRQDRGSWYHYHDYTCLPGAGYIYRVCAVNAVGDSPFAVFTTVTTPGIVNTAASYVFSWDTINSFDCRIRMIHYIEYYDSLNARIADLEETIAGTYVASPSMSEPMAIIRQYRARRVQAEARITELRREIRRLVTERRRVLDAMTTTLPAKNQWYSLTVGGTSRAIFVTNNNPLSFKIITLTDTTPYTITANLVVL